MKKENKYLEYKEKQTKTYLKTVCAFANYHDGEIIFGISDDYKVLGVNNPKDFCLNLENQINDSIKPKPDYTLKINKDTTVTLHVKKSLSTPYMYNGKTYKRNDSSTIEVDELEHKRLTLAGMNQNYEELASNKQDLTFDILKKNLKEKINIKTFNQDTLRSLNLFNDDIGYNIAASLLADINNCPGLDIVVFGSSISDIKRRKTLNNQSIIKQYYEALKIFEEEYVSEVVDNGFRKKVEKIPFDAYREAIANALIHRIWDVNANTKVEMYLDRIVISSPGGLPQGISEEQYKKGTFSLLRNPIISNVFYRLNIVEIFATGIKRINELYRESVSKPIYDVMEQAISITLPLYNINTLSKNEELILGSMQANQKYKREELQTITGLSKDKVIRAIPMLLKRNLINKEGEGKATIYIRTDK